MGLFSKWKQSSAKSGLMKSAAKQVQSGQITLAIQEIFKFYQSDDTFKNILDHFNATPDDIEAIIKGLMFSGAGGKYKGHFIPVSAVLFQDTLAYLLRSERGQVTKSQAYFEILEYFQSGAIVFEPEKAFH